MKPISVSKVQPAQHPEFTREIEDQLLRSLAELNPQSTNAPIVLSATDENGDLVGGLSGSTSYGWFLVKILWVKQQVRGRGIGRALMMAAEDEARHLGCHSAWLDTSSSLARAFYCQLGYADFGQLTNGPSLQPAGHCRWFMKKSLEKSSDQSDDIK